MNFLNEKGMTLIEVIISITLLGLIAISILPLSMYGVKYAKWNNIKLNALNLAYTQIEWLKAYDYEKLGLNISGYEPYGDIEEDKYLNEEDIIIIDGVQYKVSTGIYWEDSVSITGEPILDASKAVDVVVIAKDLYSGKEKKYSVLRTLITREGERKPAESGLIVFTYFREINTPANMVRLKLNTGQIAQTNMEGKAVFVGLKADSYNVEPISWKGNDIIAQPKYVDNTETPKWVFGEIANVEKWTYGKDIDSFFPILNFYIDFPGYIIFPEDNKYPNAEITIGPSADSYTPPEGSPDHLLLISTLGQLEDLKFWRLWKYEYEIKYNEDRYFLIDTESGNTWDGIFKTNNIEKPTYEELELGFKLMENGTFFLDEGEIKEINIEFTSKVINFKDIKFTLNNQEVDDKSYSIIQNGRELNIKFNSSPSISVDNGRITFEIINENILQNQYNMKLATDLNKSILTQKE